MNMVPSRVFLRKQALSSDVGHIVVFLDWGDVVDQDFCHILWHGYIHISFVVIQIYFQSKVIMTLPIC